MGKKQSLKARVVVGDKQPREWVGCEVCDDTRKLEPDGFCFECGRSVDEKGRCIQCPHVAVGHRCGECGRMRLRLRAKS